MLLTLKSRFVGNVYVIECAGRVVLGEEAKALETALEAGAREFTRIVLNLAEVSRLDSIAMGLLVRYAERLGKQGGGLAAGCATGVRYQHPEYDEAFWHAAKLSDGGRGDRVFSERTLGRRGATEPWTAGAAV